MVRPAGWLHVTTDREHPERRRQPGVEEQRSKGVALLFEGRARPDLQVVTGQENQVRGVLEEGLDDSGLVGADAVGLQVRKDADGDGATDLR